MDNKTMDAKYPDITVKLTEHAGNALSVLASVRAALKNADVSDAEIKEFSHEAMSGNYDHLLQTVMAWVNVE
jgi:hypothetical protein